jgi:hypothetical protein
LRDYQALPSKPNLMSYLRLRGINTSISIANLVVSYNAGDYMSIVSKTSDLNIANKGLTQIGLSVKYESGLLEMFHIYPSLEIYKLRFIIQNEIYKFTSTTAKKHSLSAATRFRFVIIG